MKTTNREYPHTHITKYNFGRLLPEGIRVNIVQQIGDKVAVKDHCGNIWHGNISDLTKAN